MRRAVHQSLGSLSTYRFGVDPYDSTKLGLGAQIFQYTGAGNEDKWAGPIPVSLARPMEQSIAIASSYPWAMQWQNNTAGEIDWIFLADIATAAATRRINAYVFNRRTGTFSWRGFVTVTFPGTSEAKIVRGLRMSYDLHTAGTVAVSGTAVTGTSTTWLADKACIGNRIGFGSTDPSLISTWYEIGAMASDTGITLSSSAGTIGGGTPYVIEDLRCIVLLTSVTTSNGGIYVMKGLNVDAFSTIGGTVPAAVATDSLRASYFLKDAATGTHLVGLGMGLPAKTSFTSQMCYSLDAIANQTVFKNNVRAALTVASGASTDAFQFKTGAGGAVVGTPTQLNNGRIATAAHGPASGVEALYFTTSTRIYCAPTSGITTASTTWLSGGYVMTENPPGSVNTFAAGGAMQSIEFSTGLDKFIVGTANSSRSYVSQFRTDGGQMDRLFGATTLQIDQVVADASTTPIATAAAAYAIWSEGGLVYLVTHGTSAITNRLYAVPMGADWEYAVTTGARLVFPITTLINGRKLASAFAAEVQVLGVNGGSGKNLGLNTEPWRMYYRTSGMNDNSGSWTLLDSSGLVNAAVTTQVQLMIEFRTIGTLNLPARICNYGVVYDDNGMSDYWMGSSNIGTDLVSKIFGFYFSVAYGATVPRLTCELYDAVTGSSLGSDDSTTQAWTWAKSTNNGGAWVAYNTTDRANDNTYVRVTPISLADNIKVRAVLREY